MLESQNEELFGPLDSNTTHALPIGDNVHHLSDKQLSKLVQLKFQNEPFRLVRQLSRDLARKETELILLRKQNFQREQELTRLCMVYGNLSSLEVDHHLNALLIEKDAQKVVSQLINSAMNEPVAPQLSPSSSTSQTHFSGNSLNPTKPSTSKDTLTSGGSLVAENVPNAHRSSPLSRALTSALVEQDRKSNWLDWLNPSDDLVSSQQTSTLASRLRSQSLKDSHLCAPKRPVELQSIAGSEASIKKDTNTDKYGFYTDMPSISPLLSKTDVPPTSRDITLLVQGSLEPTATISLGEHSLTVDRLKYLSEVYDAQSEEISKRWDVFMHGVRRGKLKAFKEEENQFFGARALNLRRSESRLAKFFVKEDETFDDSYKTLCRLVHESGIPPKFRNALWFELSGAQSKEVRGEYQRLLDLSLTSEDIVIRGHLEQINLDLHRTLPSNSFFNDLSNGQPGPQFYKLRNILYAFVAYKPTVGYAQGMNKVVGSLLLGVNESNTLGSFKLTEEDVFWIFASFTEDFVPSYGKREFFDPQSLPSIQKDVTLVQNLYLPKFLPKLSAHLKSVGVEIQMVLLRWWLGIFTESFSSIELWLKLFDDLLLSESADVKFVSYSLTILRLFERGVIELLDADEIYRLLSHLNSPIISQTNIRFQDLIHINTEYEKHICAEELKYKRNVL